MPKKLEQKLRAIASKKIRSGKMSPKRKDAYVYGGLRRSGWKPKREK